MAVDNNEKKLHGYALWRKHQCDYEEEQWRTAGPEEREDRIRQRKEYLFAAYRDDHDRAREVVECPNCEPGTVFEVSQWPSWFRCLSCDRVCVVDKDSHLTRGAGEMVFSEKLEGLRDRYGYYKS